MTEQAGFYRLPQVLEIIPVGRSTIWDWVKRGKLAAPIKLSPMCTVWRKADILAFVEKMGGGTAGDCRLDIKK